MAYNNFADNKPVASDNGLVFADDTRNNLMAMRDAVVSGTMVGWNYSTSGGTADKPDQILYTKGSEVIRMSLTWGTTGGEADNVTQMALDYSLDGVSYDSMGTQTISYDSSSNVTAINWS
jgi:hypothetical protein